MGVGESEQPVSIQVVKKCLIVESETSREVYGKPEDRHTTLGFELFKEYYTPAGHRGPVV